MVSLQAENVNELQDDSQKSYPSVFSATRRPIPFSTTRFILAVYNYTRNARPASIPSLRN